MILGFVIYAVIFGLFTLYVFFYASRALGFMVSKLCNVFVLPQGRYLSIGSLRIALVSGQVTFEHLRYSTPNTTVRVVEGTVTFRWWNKVPPVMTSPLEDGEKESPKEGDDRFGDKGKKNHNIGFGSPYQQDLWEPWLAEKVKNARVSITVKGLEYLIYNNSYAYDAVDERLAQRKGVEAIVEDAIQEEVDAMLSPDEYRDQPSMFGFLMDVIELKLLKGAFMIGNPNVATQMVVTYDEGHGYMTSMPATDPSRDYYKSVTKISLDNVVIRMPHNPDYRGEAFLVRTRKQEQEPNFALSALQNFRDFFREVRFAFINPDESFPTQSPDLPRGGDGQAPKQWQGLDRYNTVEYAKEVNVIRCSTLLAVYYMDVAGPIPPAKPDGDEPEPFDALASPRWGVDCVFSDAELCYGPWTDRQRDAIRQIFLPYNYDGDPRYDGQIGKARDYGQFDTRLFFPGHSVTRIPFREASKDGQVPAEATSLKRVPGYMDLLSEDMVMEHTMPWVLLDEDGYRAHLNIDAGATRIVTSLTDTDFLSGDSFHLYCEFHYPEKWNDVNDWVFHAHFGNAKMFFLYDHTVLFQNLSSDWSSGDPYPLAFFVPSEYRISLSLHDVELYLNVNEMNIVNRPNDIADNAYYVFYGQLLEINTILPFTDYEAVSTEIGFTLDAPYGLHARLSLPVLSTIHQHTDALEREAMNFLISEQMNINGSYLMHWKIDRSYIDSLSMSLSIHRPVFTMFGFYIRYFTFLRDNFFGYFCTTTNLDTCKEKMASTFKERAERREVAMKREVHRGATRTDPLSKDMKALSVSFSQFGVEDQDALDAMRAEAEVAESLANDFELFMHVSLLETRAVLPLHMYSSRKSATVTFQELLLELRAMPAYTDMYAMFSPISIHVPILTRETEYPLCQKYDIANRSYIRLDDLTCKMHYRYGPPPHLHDYHSQYTVDMGAFRGHLLLSQLTSLGTWANHFLYHLSDYDNALGIRLQSEELPTLVNTIMTVASVHLYIWGRDSLMELTLEEGLQLTTDSTITHLGHEQAQYTIPKVVLRALVPNEASAHTVWTEVGHVGVTVSMTTLTRKPNWEQDAQRQKKFLLAQDHWTQRVESLWRNRPLVGEAYSSDDDSFDDVMDVDGDDTTPQVRTDASASGLFRTVSEHSHFDSSGSGFQTATAGSSDFESFSDGEAPMLQSASHEGFSFFGEHGSDQDEDLMKFIGTAREDMSEPPLSSLQRYVRMFEPTFVSKEESSVHVGEQLPERSFARVYRRKTVRFGSDPQGPAAISDFVDQEEAMSSFHLILEQMRSSMSAKEWRARKKRIVARRKRLASIAHRLRITDDALRRRVMEVASDTNSKSSVTVVDMLRDVTIVATPTLMQVVEELLGSLHGKPPSTDFILDEWQLTSASEHFRVFEYLFQRSQVSIALHQLQVRLIQSLYEPTFAVYLVELNLQDVLLHASLSYRSTTAEVEEEEEDEEEFVGTVAIEPVAHPEEVDDQEKTMDTLESANEAAVLQLQRMNQLVLCGADLSLRTSTVHACARCLTLRREEELLFLPVYLLGIGHNGKVSQHPSVASADIDHVLCQGRYEDTGDESASCVDLRTASIRVYCIPNAPRIVYSTIRPWLKRAAVVTALSGDFARLRQEQARLLVAHTMIAWAEREDMVDVDFNEQENQLFNDSSTFSDLLVAEQAILHRARWKTISLIRSFISSLGTKRTLNKFIRSVYHTTATDESGAEQYKVLLTFLEGKTASKMALPVLQSKLVSDLFQHRGKYVEQDVLVHANIHCDELLGELFHPGASKNQVLVEQVNIGSIVTYNLNLDPTDMLHRADVTWNCSVHNIQVSLTPNVFLFVQSLQSAVQVGVEEGEVVRESAKQRAEEESERLYGTKPKSRDGLITSLDVLLKRVAEPDVPATASVNSDDMESAADGYSSEEPSVRIVVPLGETSHTSAQELRPLGRPTSHARSASIDPSKLSGLPPRVPSHLSLSARKIRNIHRAQSSASESDSNSTSGVSRRMHRHRRRVASSSSHENLLELRRHSDDPPDTHRSNALKKAREAASALVPNAEDDVLDAFATAFMKPRKAFKTEVPPPELVVNGHTSIASFEVHARCEEGDLSLRMDTLGVVMSSPVGQDSRLDVHRSILVHFPLMQMTFAPKACIPLKSRVESLRVSLVQATCKETSKQLQDVVVCCSGVVIPLKLDLGPQLTAFANLWKPEPHLTEQAKQAPMPQVESATHIRLRLQDVRCTADLIATLPFVYAISLLTADVVQKQADVIRASLSLAEHALLMDGLDNRAQTTRFPLPAISAAVFAQHLQEKVPTWDVKLAMEVSYMKSVMTADMFTHLLTAQRKFRKEIASLMESYAASLDTQKATTSEKATDSCVRGDVRLVMQGMDIHFASPQALLAVHTGKVSVKVCGYNSLATTNDQMQWVLQTRGTSVLMVDPPTSDGCFGVRETEHSTLKDPIYVLFSEHAPLWGGLMANIKLMGGMTKTTDAGVPLDVQLHRTTLVVQPWAFDRILTLYKHYERAYLSYEEKKRQFNVQHRMPKALKQKISIRNRMFLFHGI